eukprot:6983280-Ditylum_brightwellii.AAC.1
MQNKAAKRDLSPVRVNNFPWMDEGPSLPQQAVTRVRTQGSDRHPNPHPEQDPPPPAPLEESKCKLMRPWSVATAYLQARKLSKWALHWCKVDCCQPWSQSVVSMAVQQGPHVNALSPEAMALVQEDVQYQVKAGFCKVTKWEDLKAKWPKHLKISPVAVVLQTGRRGRIILDLSFPVYRDLLVKGRKRKGKTR